MLIFNFVHNTGLNSSILTIKTIVNKLEKICRILTFGIRRKKIETTIKEVKENIQMLRNKYSCATKCEHKNIRPTKYVLQQASFDATE